MWTCTKNGHQGISILRALGGIKFIMVRALSLPLWLLIVCVTAQVHAQEKPQPITPSVMSSAYGEKLKIRGIPNPGKINDGLYRGAQPNEQGLEELKKLASPMIVASPAEDRGSVEWDRPR